MASIEDSKFDINFNKYIEGMTPIQMVNFFQILETENADSIRKATVEESIDDFIRTIYKLNYHLLSIKSELQKTFETINVFGADKEKLVAIQTLLKTYNLTISGCINTIENTDNVLSSQLQKIREEISKRNNK